MSRVAVVDLAILGGGCAGLSLAKYLSNSQRWMKKTLVVEARASYQHDRSWCFWTPKEPWLDQALVPLVTHKWPSWQFSGQQFSAVHAAEGREYCYIPSDRFYQSAVAGLRNHPTIQLANGHEIVSVTAEGTGYLIHLADDSRVVAQQVIDTRPALYTASEQAQLWQIIYGYEIQASQPIFDSSQVGLMQQLVSTPAGTEFIYVLPFSAQHALVEWTAFSPQLSAPNLLATRLNDYLDTKFNQITLNIMRTEHAVLPMGLKRTRAAQSGMPHYSYGGQVAGAIRPSTGYAFLRIQRWARACANQLLQGKTMRARAYSPWIARVMDRLFLDILHHQPEQGARLFQCLSQGVSPSALVRFLSDEAKLPDYLQVMRALPVQLFLAHGLRYYAKAS